MSFIIDSSTTPILLAVRQHLADQSVLPIERITVVGDENAPRMQGSQLLQIWPQDFVDDKALTRGAGRNGTHIEEPFWIQLLTNLQTDEVDRNLQGFTDPALGHYALKNKVLDAMLQFWPEDSDGNALTVQPIHLGNGRKGKKPPAPQGKGWTISNMVFEVRYRQTLDLTVQ